MKASDLFNGIPERSSHNFADFFLENSIFNFCTQNTNPHHRTIGNLPPSAFQQLSHSTSHFLFRTQIPKLLSFPASFLHFAHYFLSFILLKLTQHYTTIFNLDFPLFLYPQLFNIFLIFFLDIIVMKMLVIFS